MKKLINKIKTFLAKAWGSLFFFLVDKGEVAIKVTNVVKDILNNPAIDWVVELTPTKADDILVSKAKVFVPKVANQIGLAMGILRNAEDEKDAFEKVLNYVSQLPLEGKAIFLREFSGHLALALSDDGKVSPAEMIGLVQLIYKGLIKK